MVSIIICSVSPLLLEDLKQNIAQTIGVEYEIIAIDNREKRWPIAKAYNYGVQQWHAVLLGKLHHFRQRRNSLNIHICFLCMKTQGCYLISGENL